MNSKQLHLMVQEIFTKRTPLLMVWQELADNFYPERADFTYRRSIGDEFAAHLMTSFPVQCRRDLQDQTGQMLRPTAKEWMHMTVKDQRRMDGDGTRWLDWATETQRRGMYDRVAQFPTSSKQADGDYVTFGNAAVQVRLNRDRDALLYRTWHLRDVVWMEDEDGKIVLVARRQKPWALTLVEKFATHAHSKVHKIAEKRPFEEIECIHMMVKAELFDAESRGMPWRSVHYDVQHEHEMESIAQWNKEYSIQRWQTVSGTQYAYSPAAIVALPDARLLQAMTYTLLEVGEKIANPPMIATDDVVRSDIAIYAGGTTWVDRDYDERLGDALKALTQDAKGMPLTRDMQTDLRSLLYNGFYLNKLVLPQMRPQMTAYEVGQYVAQYIRDALPLFEPMEYERNGDIAEMTFDLMLRAGAFGSPHEIPESLQGQDIEFVFESPLHDAIEQQKGNKFLEMAQLIATAAQLDTKVSALPDTMTALRDALLGKQIPANWLNTEVTVDQIAAQQEAAQEAATTLAAAEKGSIVAKNLGAAGTAMTNSAQAVPA